MSGKSGRAAGIALFMLVGLLAAVHPNSLQAQEDRYVTQYLKVAGRVALPLDSSGKLASFTTRDLNEGKVLFENNCKNCHLAGNNIPGGPNLALNTLKGATPPRDNLTALVQFSRKPVTYQGTKPTICRDIPKSYLSDLQLKKLYAFVLRASDLAPGWGTIPSGAAVGK
jgi:photosystem II cytochrome c550